MSSNSSNVVDLKFKNWDARKNILFKMKDKWSAYRERADQYLFNIKRSFLLKKSGMLRGIIFRWKNDKVVNFILVL
jgi:hypothetical protein